MKIYPIGSCRVNDPIRQNEATPAGLIRFSHSSREALQQIKLFSGEIEIPKWYGEVTGIFEPTQDDCLLVEICTEKVFWVESEGKRVYLPEGEWLKVQDQYPSGQSRLSTGDIKKDLLGIKAVFPGKLFLVPHLIPSIRKEDINAFPWLENLFLTRRRVESTLRDIAESTDGIEFININEIFRSDDSNSLLQKREGNNIFELDLNHYSKTGLKEAYNFIKKSISDTYE